MSFKRFSKPILAACMMFAPAAAMADSAAQEQTVHGKVLRAEPYRYESRPNYGFIPTLRFEGAVPTKKPQKLFIHLKDEAGQTVLEHSLWPTKPTNTWEGDIEYAYTFHLPQWIPRAGKSIDGLGPGTYDVYTGLVYKNGKHVAFGAGEGVTADDDNRYHVGQLVIREDAPLPKLAEPTLDLAGYEITFQDEFDDISVSAWGPAGPDGTKWIAHTPYNGDFGDADFVDPTDEFPFTTQDGILSIEVKKEPAGWKGGLLSSIDNKGDGFAQQYGYFEMRAKLPVGPGTWPAFWLHGQPRVTDGNNKKRKIIEIDILEQYGHWPNKLTCALHVWDRSGAGKSRHDGRNFIIDGMADDYHTYGAMVTKEHIIYYFDGVELRREETPESGHDKLYVMVDLALGPGWPLDKTPSPSIMLVDYVRVYAKK